MKTKQFVYWLGIVSGAGIGVGIGCARELPQHCRNNFGDHSCVEDGKGSYCSRCTLENDGCTSEMPSDDCHFGANGTGIDVTDAVTATHAGSGTSSMGGTSIDSVDGGYSSDVDGTVGEKTTSGEDPDDSGTTIGLGGCGICPSDAPVCTEGVCVECTFGNPGVCDPETQICDTASNVCLTMCGSHGECGEAGCNFYEGFCLPADAIVHVGPEDDQVSTITAAVETFSAGERGTIVVHESDVYYDSVVIDDARVLAILAAEGNAPVWDNAGIGVPQLSVSNGTVLLDGLQFTGNGHVRALQFDGVLTQVWVDRSRIVGNTGGGILLQDGADVTLRNCFVGSATNFAMSPVPAMEVVGVATAEISYSTLVGSFGGGALSCSVSSDVDVSDSVLLEYSVAEPVSCDMASFDHNASEVALAGPGNVVVGPFEWVTNWFTSPAADDFLLTVPGAVVFQNVAVWNTGDPPTDIEGNPRNKNDGDADHAGADQP